MKQRHSQYRQRSKCASRRQVQKAFKQNHVFNSRNNANGIDMHIPEENLKWCRFGVIIQVADFLVDNLPDLIIYLKNLLGMG